MWIKRQINKLQKRGSAGGRCLSHFLSLYLSLSLSVSFSLILFLSLCVPPTPSSCLRNSFSRAKRQEIVTHTESNTTPHETAGAQKKMKGTAQTQRRRKVDDNSKTFKKMPHPRIHSLASSVFFGAWKQKQLSLNAAQNPTAKKCAQNARCLELTLGLVYLCPVFVCTKKE